MGFYFAFQDHCIGVSTRKGFLISASLLFEGNDDFDMPLKVSQTKMSSSHHGHGFMKSSREKDHIEGSAFL